MVGGDVVEVVVGLMVIEGVILAMGWVDTVLVLVGDELRGEENMGGREGERGKEGGRGREREDNIY